MSCGGGRGEGGGGGGVIHFMLGGYSRNEFKRSKITFGAFTHRVAFAFISTQLAMHTMA